MALADLDFWKVYAGITSISADAQLQIFLDMATAAVCSYCNRDFQQTTYPAAAENGQGDSGYYDGPCGRLLVLRQLPVTAIASISSDPTGYFGTNPDGSFASATLLTAGVDYVLKTDGCLPGTSTKCSYQGIVERINGTWGSRISSGAGRVTSDVLSGLGNLKVAYTAGYTADSMPIDLKAACCMVATWIRRNSDKGAPMQSENLGGYSYSIMAASPGQFPEVGTVRGMLGKYREQAV